MYLHIEMCLDTFASRQNSDTYFEAEVVELILLEEGNIRWLNLHLSYTEYLDNCAYSATCLTMSQNTNCRFPNHMDLCVTGVTIASVLTGMINDHLADRVQFLLFECFKNHAKTNLLVNIYVYWCVRGKGLQYVDPMHDWIDHCSCGGWND
jgi:hypothetical protein